MSRYIDADALKKAFVKPMNDFVEGASNSLDIGEIIDAQPTADVAPAVQGKWIVEGQEVYCSKCKKICGYNWHGASAFSKFCPNCGARMDGVL